MLVFRKACILKDLSGEIVATPGERRPYRVIIRNRGMMVMEIDADSLDDGTRVLTEMLDVLQRLGIPQ